MKLVRFELRSSTEFGYVIDDEVYSAAMDPLLGHAVGTRIDQRRNVRLLAPCEPRVVVGVARNYPGVGTADLPAREPLVFLKSPRAVTAAGERIVSPWPDASVWAEPELCIVLSRELTRAGRDEAKAAILGYSLVNDVTCASPSGDDHHLPRCKSPDTFCPLGPWIDTGFVPRCQKLELYVNGELIRQGTLDSRFWNELDLLVYLSSWMTLCPWDVVLTGAPPRVTPKRYLKPGDVCQVKVDELGCLENLFAGAEQ